MTPLRRILRYEALEQRCLLSSAGPTVVAMGPAPSVSAAVQSASAVVVKAAAVQTVNPVDNSSGAPAYVEHGPGWTTSSLPGYLGTSRYHSGGGSGTNTASWTVPGLAPGRYEVFATWSAYNNRATNSPYTIFDGTVAQGTILVNQQLTPSGVQAFGDSWHNLGTFSVASGQVTVTLGDNANGAVSADAVWIVPAPPAPTVTGVSPTSGPASGGTTVTIVGTNLAGATAVKFGTVAATIVSNTGNQIVARSPVESPGTVDVTVSGPGGPSATTSTDTFTCIAAPVVMGVSPTSGPATGGTTVTIVGTNLAARPR